MICSDSYLFNVMKERLYFCIEGRIFFLVVNIFWKFLKIDLSVYCFFNILWIVFMSKERSKIDGFVVYIVGIVFMVIIDRMVLWKNVYSICYFINCLEKILCFCKLDVLKFW